MQHGTLPMYHGTLPMYHGTLSMYHGTLAVYHGTFSYGKRLSSKRDHVETFHAIHRTIDCHIEIKLKKECKNETAREHATENTPFVTLCIIMLSHLKSPPTLNTLSAHVEHVSK